MVLPAIVFPTAFSRLWPHTRPRKGNSSLSPGTVETVGRYARGNYNIIKSPVQTSATSTASQLDLTFAHDLNL